jgi:hypothetical protein
MNINFTFKKSKPAKIFFVALFMLLMVGVENMSGTNLYSYQTGNWNVATTWTTDPGGTTLVGAAVPANGDVVEILSGRTVTLSANVTQTGLSIILDDGGILDMSTNTFATLTSLSGKGILKISSGTFPTVATNTFVNAGGGTVEYYNLNSTGIASSQLTYNNLIVSNYSTSANTIYLSSTSNPSYIINGDFTLKNNSTGSLTFDFGNSTASDNLINMTVYGDFTVNAGCNVMVNNFATSHTIPNPTNSTTSYPVHTLNLLGNLTNNGSIRFTGLPSPVANAYYTLTTTASGTNYGDVQVFFKGSSDNTITCNGVTDFYRMIVEKGIDQTYILSVNSSNINNFALYAPNYQGNSVFDGGTDSYGWGAYYKALYIHTGTLKLGANINIPSLTEGGQDFNLIPSAALWVNGATVSTTVSGVNGTGYQAATLYGRLQISAGSFSTGDASGIVLGQLGTPQLLIEGSGLLDASQVWAASGTNIMSYIQTGGTANFRMQGENQSGAMLGLSSSYTAFIMTGGTINFTSNTFISGGTNYNILDIESQVGNYQVTGGTINFNLPSSGTTYTANSTVPFYNVNISRNASTTSGTTSIQWNSAGAGSSSNANLTVLNDLSIGANTTLDLGSGSVNLNVAHNFSIASGGTYTPGTNTTTFNGFGGSQLFSISGTITSGLNNLTLANTSLVSIDNAITVNAGLTIGDGCKLNDAGKVITVKGNITNSGTHVGTGSIIMAGTVAQTIDGDGSGTFQNLTLNNTSGTANSAPISLLANTSINGVLTLTANNRLFNIQNYNLALGSSASISSSTTNYIVTNGDPGDGGVTKTYASNTAFDFPVGSYSTNRAATYAYTLATIGFSGTPTTYGSITVIPVGFEHPNTTTNGRSLTFFWRVKSSGFNLGSATVTHSFVYNQTDVVGTESSYIPTLFNRTTSSWNNGTNAFINTTSNKIIDWSTPTNSTAFIDGDYTAGDNAFGTLTTYYSNVTTGNWSTLATWSTDPIISVVPAAAPGVNNPVVIRNGHTITNDGSNQSSTLFLQGTGVLDCNTQTGLIFGMVSGTGKIRITTTGTAVFPGGDFSDFIGNNGGTVEYYTLGNNDYIIPSTAKTYKNLVLTPNTGRYIGLPDQNITIYGDMTVQGQSLTGIARLYSSTSITRTLTVNGSLYIASGTLQYRDGFAQNVIVNGNVSVSSVASFNVRNNGTIANKLSIAGSLTNNGVLTFIAGSCTCDIAFNGNTNAVFDGTGSGGTTLNNLIVNKGNSQTTSLTLSVAGTLTTLSDNWLTLQNGTFKYMRNVAIDFPISTTSSFTIPATAGLYVNYSTSNNILIANSGSNTNDLYLNGNLTIVNGNVYVGPTNGTTAFNNDIEYSASGTSTINMQGGKLIVNGQIRRNPGTPSGVLQYVQSNGDVTINGQAAITTNAKLEVLNDGSVFTMSGGTITIVRGGGGSTFGDLYLRPETSSVTGGTIIFTQSPGTGPVVDLVQSYLLDANVPLYNLTITGKNTATVRNAAVNMMVSPLVLNGSLLLSNAYSIFNAVNGTNNIDLTINGNLTNNGSAGSYLYGTNQTTFSGGVQTVGGTSITNFYDLQINPVTSVTLNGASLVYTVNHNLTLSKGQLLNGTNSINLKGNITNNATYDGDANTGGVILNNLVSVQQHIAGTGTFGRLELNNAAGAQFDNSVTFNKNIKLTTGILDMAQFLLTLGGSSNFEGSPFSASKMLVTDGVFSNTGIQKYFPIISSSTTFTYPLGTGSKYTPVDLTITTSGSVGYVRVNNINAHHPAVTDASNVLQYYWEVESSTLSGFAGNLVLNYNQNDVKITGSNLESNYVATELLVPGTNWSKAATGASTDNVDETNNKITFNFASGTSSLSGQYTAGIDGAIPITVPQFISNNSGNWSDNTIWSPTNGSTFSCPTGGPNGFIVTIRPNDSIVANVNYCSSYRATINGKLKVISGIFGHNFGTVDGNGTLYLESGGLPAGRYTSFFDCGIGGTLEFGGTASTYTLISGYLFQSLPRLFFTGTGTRVLPNNDMVVCSKLKIDGPSVDNSVYNKEITIQGTMERYHTGTFISGSGTISFAGSLAQTLGGTLGNFSGTNAFYNLEINNSNGLTLNGATEIKGNLLLTAGNIISTTTNSLTISNTLIDCVTPTGGSAISYVSGPLTKSVIQGDNFVFPVGKGTNVGNLLTLSATETGTQNWTVEYFNPSIYTSFSSPLTGVNTKEYWNVASASGNKAIVDIKWIASSDLTPLMTQNGLSDMNVAQYDAINSYWVQQTSSRTGDNYNGSATTTSKIVIPSAGNYNYTLACTNIPKPKIKLAPTGPVCGNAGIPVTLSSGNITPVAPFSITYTKDNGSTQTYNPSSFPAILPTDPAGGVYRITGFTYNYPSGTQLTGVFDVTPVTVYALPTTAVAGTDQSLCGATTATLAGNSPSSGTGLWSIVSGAGGTIIAPTSNTSTFTGTNGSTYTLRWTISNGTCTSSDDVVIKFPLLAAQPADFTTSTTTVCQGTTGVVYTVPNDPTVTSYNWSYTVGTGATIIGTGNSVTVNFSNTATSGTLGVTATNSCNTSTPRTIAVTVSQNIWVGTASSSDWATADNWQAKVIPPLGADVAFATTPLNNLVLDGNRTIGNLTNTSSMQLIIPAGKCLTSNVITNNSTNQIYIQASTTGGANGSLIFKNAKTSPVYATVEMYTLASNVGTITTPNHRWQYFGIPVRSVIASPTFDGSFLRRFEESGQTDITRWVALINESSLTPFTGYEITQEVAKTISFSGQLYNRDTILTLSVTSGASYSGQHLYANPYTAAIKISDLVFGTGVNKSVYLYNTGSHADWTGGSSSENVYAGQYNCIPQANAGDAGITSQIVSMQGFLVYTTTNLATLTIPYSSVAGNIYQQRVSASDNSSDKVCIRMDVKGENYADRMWLFAVPSCTRNFDNGWDGPKILGSALTPQLFAMEADGNYQVNSVNDMNDTYLGFQAGVDPEYTLTFTNQNLEKQYAGVYLLDLVENKTIDITASGTDYTFTAETTSEPVKRFKIITRHYEKDASDADTQVKIFSSQGTIFVQNYSNLVGDCMVYDIAGHYLMKVPFGANCVTAITRSLTPGVYVTKTITGNERISKRLIVQ